MSSVSERLREALTRPEVYPHSPAQVVVCETHISWVFLAGEFAYKLKKPVVLEFLDYGSAERRREMCMEEIRLNRRLAPDIYLGVRGLALDNGELEFVAPDDPRALDFVVEMGCFDERDTVASRLARGELGADQIAAVGRVLASFHAGAPRVLDAVAPVLAVERQFERNVQELLGRIEQRAEIGRVQALERFAHGFITALADTFERRAVGGSVRDGHGDLRAEHVLVDGVVAIVDCVEFDPALRRLDVADDLAFLVLDLVAGGAERLSHVLVQAYREAGGDPGEDRLISFYAAYRALVRAKVGLVRAAQLPSGSSEHAHESASARELISFAEGFAWRARLPLLLVVCGPPASGKSHLAAALAETSGLPHLSSDVTRKQIAGLAATQQAPRERYGAEWNERTYAELAQRARHALESTGGAVVDATFRHLTDRRIFASELGDPAPVLFIECRAPRSVLAERAARRERDPQQVSDADVSTVLLEFEAWEPLDEVPAQAHLILRTDRSTEEIMGDVMALIDRRLPAIHERSP